MESSALSPTLLFNFHQGISIFREDRSISTGSGCECRVLETAVGGHLPHSQRKRPPWQGTSPGARWGRKTDLLRTLHSMLTKIRLYSLLPDCLKMFTF